MRKIITLSFAIMLLVNCKTTFKLGQCADLYFDIEKGTLNGVNGTATINEIKTAFPCFTGESKEGAMANCGGGVFFLKHHFFFYTFNDYIEIRRNFKGNLSKPLLGISEQELTVKMGKPDKEEVLNKEYEISVSFYKKSWGTIAFKKNKKIITEIQLYYNETINDIDFCK